MQTVPRRPGGGCQRAKRSDTPSGVFKQSVTKLSGTGLAEMEMSFIEAGRLCPAYSSLPPLLNWNQCRASFGAREIMAFCQRLITLARSLTGSHIAFAQALAAAHSTAGP